MEIIDLSEFLLRKKPYYCYFNASEILLNKGYWYEKSLCNVNGVGGE